MRLTIILFVLALLSAASIGAAIYDEQDRKASSIPSCAVVKHGRICMGDL
jgi:hypothetical protein